MPFSWMPPLCTHKAAVNLLIREFSKQATQNSTSKRLKTGVTKCGILGISRATRGKVSALVSMLRAKLTEKGELTTQETTPLVTFSTKPFKTWA